MKKPIKKKKTAVKKKSLKPKKRLQKKILKKQQTLRAIVIVPKKKTPSKPKKKKIQGKILKKTSSTKKVSQGTSTMQVNLADLPKEMICSLPMSCTQEGPIVKGLKTYVVPSGVYITRVASVGLDIFEPGGYTMPRSRPLFYAGLDRPIADLVNSDCRVFQVKEKLVLLDLFNTDNLKVLSDNLLTKKQVKWLQLLTGYGLTEPLDEFTKLSGSHFCDYPSKEKEELVSCPVGFPDEKTELEFMLDMPGGEYTNLLFLRIICRLGLDGWITRALQVPQRINGEIRGTYPPEMTVCNPRKKLTLIDNTTCLALNQRRIEKA